MRAPPRHCTATYRIRAKGARHAAPGGPVTRGVPAKSCRNQAMRRIVARFPHRVPDDSGDGVACAIVVIGELTLPDARPTLRKTLASPGVMTRT